MASVPSFFPQFPSACLQQLVAIDPGRIDVAGVTHVCLRGVLGCFPSIFRRTAVGRLHISGKALDALLRVIEASSRARCARVCVRLSGRTARLARPARHAAWLGHPSRRPAPRRRRPARPGPHPVPPPRILDPAPPRHGPQSRAPRGLVSTAAPMPRRAHGHRGVFLRRILSALHYYSFVVFFVAVV